MATHSDPLTELPPPSRFDPEDLELLSDDPSQVIPTPAPFVAWRNDEAKILRPELLLLGFSRPSCTLLHHIPGKKLLASIVLPGISMAGNSIAAPSPEDHCCCLYALDGDCSIVAALVQYRIPPEKYHEWVRVLFAAVNPEAILAMELLQAENFRSRLSVDDPMLFTLETDAMRAEKREQRIPPFLPSGSLIDGPAAAVLSYCQMKSLRARLLVSWPERDVSCLGKSLQDLTSYLPGARTLGFAQASKASVGKRGISTYELFM
ncbi:hypothetical protein SELMODRAFT_418784 [Selaginella moellendorffii]|uniref:Uncharacterized protein n=1 Tax=Selaginella moellendorffii TaxID=88036 RepID=D8S6D5_SELML|nr:uncharacterized protein LOC9659592 [Selaginella moellendorffii]EFJ20045.1 hypothetical protein SELMODRAFT_418784 [Selaginella moellendorffii]|eukprot:XP_002979088.1 uncharacterized protein LOC9659592 [Selaginella moellendorffii]